MHLFDLHKKLIAAARVNPPGASVPLAFEKRIIARIKSLPEVDAWAFWARALWRAAAPCIAIMIVLGAWSWLSADGGAPGSDLSQDFENTVFAAADADTSTETLW